MSLSAGTRLGPYQVIGPLGAGGMGEVYRARDTRLGREVAIKVLPDSMAADPDRLARFDREARVLASLNHPNIAHIHGVEQAGATQALVMELVDGDTLAERLQLGRVPIDEALPIARQIAEALEAAHEQGIIHRDLKPANIKIRPDGTVKVLDFGLAKAIDPAPSSADAINSPTISARATMQGVILGTAAYMSPEQAMGKPADRRSDLWAFGVVLMEMLTGRRVFDGETVSHVIAAVLKSEPEWSALPAETPAVMSRLLRRLLAKEPSRRLNSAADAQLDIDEILHGAGQPADTPTRRGASFYIVAAAFVAGVLLTAGVVALRPHSLPVKETPTFTSIELPAGYELGEGDAPLSLPTRTPVLFTPDGRSIVIQASRDGKRQLFVRPLDRRDARPIAGTEDARVPFVSPDGKWVGFYSNGELRKVPLDGGETVTICALQSATGPGGAVWGTGDVILFPDGISRRMMRVAGSGGRPAPVTDAVSLRRQQVTPFFLPDGRHFLFADVSRLDVHDSSLMIGDLGGGPVRRVVQDASDGRLLPNGDLAFMRRGSLMTMPFDAASGVPRGDAVMSLREVMQSGLRNRAGDLHTGAGMFSVSSLGSLAVVRGELLGPVENRLIWVAPDGTKTPAEPNAGSPIGSRIQPRISPDGSRIVVQVQSPTSWQYWLADSKRATWTACPECAVTGAAVPSIWSPDGRELLVQATDDTLVVHSLDATQPNRPFLREEGRIVRPVHWLNDDRVVYLSQVRDASVRQQEIRLLDRGATVGRRIADGYSPALSPDGRWLAYVSSDSESPNIVVQTFPVPGQRQRVSGGRGVDPAWSRDGRTLYYLAESDGSVVTAIDLGITPTLAAGPARTLFRTQSMICGVIRCYDVAADGRFLMRQTIDQPRQPVTRFDLILNWTAPQQTPHE